MSGKARGKIQRMYQVEDLPPTHWRRRLLTLVLALTTVYVIMSHVLGKPGATNYTPPPRADKPLCQAGQTSGCVGGMATVIVAPAASGAAR
jgi:hypothetical protein